MEKTSKKTKTKITKSKTESQRSKSKEKVLKNKEKRKSKSRLSIKSGSVSALETDNASRKKSRAKSIASIEPLYPPIDPNDPIQHKESIDFCTEIAEEFRKEAEDIFMDRFYHREKGWHIATELRDTWLRIIECFYMDSNISTENAPLSGQTKDTPPLPLAHDFWARGNLELFPDTRRESILDPFIRRKRLGDLMTEGGRSASVKSISSMPSWQLALFATGEEEDEEPEVVGQDEAHKNEFELGGGDEGEEGVDKKIKRDEKLSVGTEKLENDEEEELETSHHSLLGGGDAASESLKMLLEDKELLVLKEATSWLSAKSSHSGLKPWTISERKIILDRPFTVFGQTTDEGLRDRLDALKEKELQGMEDEDARKTQSEPDGHGGLQILCLDDPETDSLYENAALVEQEENQDSQVPSQLIMDDGNVSNLIGEQTDVEENGPNDDEGEDGMITKNLAKKADAVLHFPNADLCRKIVEGQAHKGKIR